MDDDVFDKLRFVNEIGTQIRSQVGEEARTHSVEDTGAVIHGTMTMTMQDILYLAQVVLVYGCYSETK